MNASPSPARVLVHRALRALWFLVRIGVLAAFVGIAAFAGLLAYYGRDLPDVNALRNYDPLQTTRVVDRRGNLVGEIFAERRTVIPAVDIPNVMVISVLAAEDAGFYAHRGLDYRGIARAILRDLASGHALQGASTITQQVVKNILLTPERTLARKIRELVLARRIEQTLTKEEILALYLNTIYFGDGRYGIEEAALYYFGKHARELTLAESTLLAGLPQAPSRLNPYRNREGALRRQRYVLGQLEAKLDTHFRNHLTLEDIRRARDTELVFAPRTDDARRESPAPEVLELVRAELRALVGDEAFRRGGFRVVTTIDLSVTRAARTALQTQLARIDGRQRHFGPLPMPRGSRANTPPPRVETLRAGRSFVAEVTGTDDATGRIDLDVGGHRAYALLREHARFNPEALVASAFAPRGARAPVSLVAAGSADEPAKVHLELGPEGAVVVLEPRSRDILALIGGASATAGFNRATQARRQPGSTFKAFVYSAALRSRRFHPASIITPEEIVADGALTRVPDADEFLEPTPLRRALARSLNPVAVHLFLALGPEAVIAEARNAGISSPLDPNPALALGASEVTPIEITNAYATFASGGLFAEPRLISRILDRNGRPIALRPRLPERQAMSPAEAFLITSMLRSVVDDGTATAARSLQRPLAGKTGTTNDARDTWFVGYSPSFVTGVWIGFDDRRPMGRAEEGARSALPVFIDVMRAASGDGPPRGFSLPPGIELVSIDPASGLRAQPGAPNAVEEVFLLGAAPTAFAELPDAGMPDAGLAPQEELPPPAPLDGPKPPPAESSVVPVPAPTPAPTEVPTPTLAPTPPSVPAP